MDRRHFIKNSSFMLGTLSLGDMSALENSKKRKIKVGLVGCGGRGMGSAFQAMEADPDVEITALADIFQDKLDTAQKMLAQKYGDRFRIKKKRIFLGFDAYKKLMATDIDIVLLAAPPNFRPDHLEEAVQRNKHIFCEKPVAVDIPGVHRIQESIKLAKEKKLCMVSGFCFRYVNASRELVKRLHGGAIGDLKQISTFRLGGELTFRPHQPEWSPIESELRNWYFYQRYSGDLVNEQSIHSIDYMSWVMEGKMPMRVSGIGGRQNRPWDRLGNTFDHFSLEFDYGNGVKGFHFARQQTGTEPRNTVDIIGAHGLAHVTMLKKYEIGGTNPWEFTDPLNNMYQTQQNELVKAVKDKTWVFDGDEMAKSTLLAIWGREATYTGKTISYEEIMASTKILGPNSTDYSWNMETDQAEIPRPGHYPFS